MLNIIQNDQNMLIPNFVLELFRKGTIGCFYKAKRLSDGQRNQVRVFEWSQSNKENAIGEFRK